MNRLPLDEAIGWAERRAGSDEPVAQLTAAVRLSEELRVVGDELVGHFVTRARAAGRSWTDIGTAFGISRQAAHERFAAAVPPAVLSPERFAPDAQAAAAAAGEAMHAFRHNYLGTEHVLLGLVTQGESLAATALARLGITEERVRAAIAEIIGYGDAPTTTCHGVAPRLKRALERSGREAKRTGHRRARGEHLLLAIATADGVATQILRRHGVDERALREQIAALLPEAPEIAAAIRQPPRRRLRRS